MLTGSTPLSVAALAEWPEVLARLLEASAAYDATEAAEAALLAQCQAVAAFTSRYGFHPDGRDLGALPVAVAPRLEGPARLLIAHAWFVGTRWMRNGQLVNKGQVFLRLLEAVAAVKSRKAG